MRRLRPWWASGSWLDVLLRQEPDEEEDEDEDEGSREEEDDDEDESDDGYSERNLSTVNVAAAIGSNCASP